MINNYILDRELLDEFLDCILNDQISETYEIKSLVEECINFSAFLHSNNYFFSKNIQRKINKNTYSVEYLEKVFQLQEDKLFKLEEMSGKFIAFMILHQSNSLIDLDEHLREIQEDFINSNYGKQIRD